MTTNEFLDAVDTFVSQLTSRASLLRIAALPGWDAEKILLDGGLGFRLIHLRTGDRYLYATGVGDAIGFVRRER